MSDIVSADLGYPYKPHKHNFMSSGARFIVLSSKWSGWSIPWRAHSYEDLGRV